MVSSTRLRETIRAGGLDLAGQMLGRTYSLSGRVIHGNQLGGRIGFPTANLDVAGLVLPPDGVYAAQVVRDGQTHRAVVNIGLRPTLQDPAPQRHVEAHLLDFNGPLYGEELEIALVRKLRDEIKFPSVAALKEQIARDIAQAKTHI